MIHVCYSFTDEKGTYSQIVGTSIASLFMTTAEDVVVHLIHDHTLTAKNYAKFVELAEKFKRKIRFYDLDKILPDVLNNLKNTIDSALNPRLGIGTLYRFFISYVLPSEIDRIIYLDADTIVNMDICELWNTDLEGKVLAAVSDYDFAFGASCSHHLIDINLVSRESYFCAGVMLLDLQKFKTYNLVENGISVLKKYPNCDCMDQDILNFYFASNYKKLNVKYDISVEVVRKET